MLTDPLLMADLAQASPTRVLAWVAAMIVLIIVGGIVAMWLRRSYLDDWGSGASAATNATLSLHDLRRLHAQGRLSDEEFESLKGAAVRAHAGASPAPDLGRLQAKPGVDLTGEPLPPFAPPRSPDGEDPGENRGGPDADRGPEA
jgi:hypothetical protein